MPKTLEPGACKCGGVAKVWKPASKMYFVRCLRTGLYNCWHGPDMETREEAVREWNALMELWREHAKQDS